MGKFNELRTEYECSYCGKPFPVGLSVFGLDVRLEPEETERSLIEHVFADPVAHAELLHDN